MVAFLIWVRMLLAVLPPVVLFENVTQFPLSLLGDLLGQHYSLDSCIFDPALLGWPVRRKRRYVVLIAKSHRCAWRPCSVFVDALRSQRVLPGRLLIRGKEMLEVSAQRR